MASEENLPLLQQQPPLEPGPHEDTNEEEKPRSKRTKWAIVASCATWGFLTGVERAIVLPTLWLYLTHKFGNDAAQTYYGGSLAAFNLSVFLFAPVYGLLAYKGFRTKFLLVISNQLEVVGNIIYFVASAPWMIGAGRLLCGVGSGSEVPLYADVVRVTDSGERTFFIIVLLLARQVGLILGPSVTLLFRPVQLPIGSVLLNIYNSPGFLMAILWALHTILALVIYPDISKDGQPISHHKDSSDIQRLEQKIISKVYQGTKPAPDDDNGSGGGSSVADQLDKMVIKCKVYSSYCTLTLLCIVFAIYFCLMSAEAVLPPVTVRHLDWTEVENSWAYLIAGILVVVTFGVLQKLTPCCKDRAILSCGLSLLMASYTWMGASLCFINSDQKMLYAVLICLSLLLHVIGMSLAVACAESMFTKALPSHEMDLAQSVLRTVINLALLVGPFMVGLLQMHAYIVFIIMFTLVTLSFVLLVHKYFEFDL